MSDLIDPTIELLQAMGEVGLFPKQIQWDDSFHRFPGIDQQGRGDNGWYKAFADQRGATFGDHRTKEQWKWPGDNPEWAEKMKHLKPLSAAEVRKKKAEAEAKRAAEQEKAQAAIDDLWNQATKCTDHPYLANRGITNAAYLRSVTDKKTGQPILLIPMCDNTGDVQSMQRIWPDGTRRHMWRPAGSVGLYNTIGAGTFDRKKPVLFLCEGWATGWSIHAATGKPVIVAFFDGGLPTVGKIIRKKFPDARIIVAADNDRWTKVKRDGKMVPNPGVVAARKTAKAINGEVAIPDFDLRDVPEGEKRPTDYDDLRQREGLEAVLKWLDPKMASRAITTIRPKEEETEAVPEPEDDGAAAEKKPGVKRDPEGFLKAVKAIGWDIRYNLLADRAEWRDPDTGKWETVSKYLHADISHQIRERCVFKRTGKPAIFGVRGTFEEYANVNFRRRRIDPFAEWLDSLEWDGISRIDSILEDHFGADPTDLAVWCSRYLFMATVARTRDPGRKIDQHPVFVGKPGCGKTSFVEQSLPPGFEEAFRDLNLKDDKTAMESLQGCLVAEIGEGHWLTKADAAWLKTFLTRRDDGASSRKAYRADPAAQLRRASIIITADHDQALPNDLNLRRFVPVKLEHGCAVEALYEEHREHYWAEAVHRIDAGEDPRLPWHLIPEAHRVAHEHRSRRLALEDAVAQVLDHPNNATTGYLKSLKLVRRVRDLLPGNYPDSEIYKAAELRGWVKKRRRHISGKNPFWAWTPGNKDGS